MGTRVAPNRAGSGAAGGSDGLAAAPSRAGSRVRGLQLLQSLGQAQFLLDGHAQQRVQGLLLVLGGRELPLHLVQLGHVLVTPAGRRMGRSQTSLQRN